MKKGKSKPDQQSTTMWRRALCEQTIVHNREVVQMAVRLMELKEALRSSIEMVSAAKRNLWTPADDKRLEKIRFLVL